jgi:hypothetical protein
MKKPFKRPAKQRSSNDNVQPYIAGQSSGQYQGQPEGMPSEDDLALDNECAICFSLQEAITALARISLNIKMCSQGSSKKKEFGLDKSFIDSQISTIKRMVKFHQYYHSTGEALSDNDFGLHSNNENPSPPNFKRFRPK